MKKELALSDQKAGEQVAESRQDKPTSRLGVHSTPPAPGVVDSRYDLTHVERQHAAAQENVDDHQRPHLGPGAGDNIPRNLEVKNDGKIDQERTGHQRDMHTPTR